MPKTIIFKDYPNFRPNLTPREMFQSGIFGGTYYRPIHSSVINKDLKNMHLEHEYLRDIDSKYLCATVEDLSINKYKRHSGTTLEYWESKHWISKYDPYGWVQWYCRFYSGRRCEDDDRQIKRWLSFAGPKGRFKVRLINMIKKRGKEHFNDYSISPVIRQGLLQWAYEITPSDLD